MSESTKLITIPLHEYIDDLLAWRDRCKLPEERAKAIIALDVNEDLCHVSVENNNYILWRIKDWKESEKRRKIEREKSEKLRLEWTIFKDNIRLGVTHMWLLSGIDKRDLVPIVYKILRKNPTNLLKQGVMGLRKPFVPSDISSIVCVEFEGESIKL